MAERSIFGETFWHLPKPKLSAESRKRALSVDYYLKVVLHPHVSLRGERHTVELIPIPVVSLFDVAPTVVRQIQPQEIRGTEIRHRVAVREVAAITGHPDHAGVILALLWTNLGAIV